MQFKDVGVAVLHVELEEAPEAKYIAISRLCCRDFLSVLSLHFGSD